MKEECTMKKWIVLSLTLTVCAALFLLPITGCGKIEIPDDYKKINLSSLVSDFEKNSLRVKETYENQWVSLVCKVDSIDSREHFSLKGNYVYIECTAKNRELDTILMDLNEGNRITVVGVVKSISKQLFSWDTKVKVEIDVYEIKAP